MQTGFVGLGAMGAHMARSLRRAGLLTGVWNRTAGKAAALAAELRCIAFSSLAELAGNCEAVVICVSADEDVREFYLGTAGGAERRSYREVKQYRRRRRWLLLIVIPVLAVIPVLLIAAAVRWQWYRPLPQPPVVDSPTCFPHPTNSRRH